MKISKRTIIALLIGAGALVQSAHAQPMENTGVMSVLSSMESPAEDMLDAIDGKDMEKLNILYHKINISIEELNKLPVNGEAEGRQRAMLNSWFNLIALEMKEMDDFPALASVINQFSGQLIIATKFEHGYQKNIAWMDYLGRELLLLNTYSSKSTHEKALIQVRKTELNKTWKSIRLLLTTQQGGNALITKIDPTVQAILHESKASKLIALSIKELDMVDDVESFFHIE